MEWYYELMLITSLLLTLDSAEAQTLLSVLTEPTYGPEQEFALSLAKQLLSTAEVL